MTLDIIRDNYINNHKYSLVWRWFLIIFLITSILRLFDLVERSELFETIYNLSFGILIFVSLVNSFLFTRIGKLEMKDNLLISNIDEEIETIDLETIKMVKIYASNRNHYVLTFDSEIDIMVKIKHHQLDELKQIFIKNNIEIINSGFLNKLKKLFTKTKQI